MPLEHWCLGTVSAAGTTGVATGDTPTASGGSGSQALPLLGEVKGSAGAAGASATSGVARLPCASPAGGRKSQVPLLLPASRWPWMPLREAGAGCAVSPAVLCSLGRWLSHHGEGVGVTGTTAAVSPVPPPLCILVHPPPGAQRCGSLWCPGVLDRGTFVEL